MAGMVGGEAAIKGKANWGRKDGAEGPKDGYLRFRSRTTEDRRMKERDECLAEESTKGVEEGGEAPLLTSGGNASQVISCSRWLRSMRASVRPFRVTFVPGPRLSYVSSMIRPSFDRHITTGGGEPDNKRNRIKWKLSKECNNRREQILKIYTIQYTIQFCFLNFFKNFYNRKESIQRVNGQFDFR